MEVDAGSAAQSQSSFMKPFLGGTSESGGLTSDGNAILIIDSDNNNNHHRHNHNNDNNNGIIESDINNNKDNNDYDNENNNNNDNNNNNNDNGDDHLETCNDEYNIHNNNNDIMRKRRRRRSRKRRRRSSLKRNTNGAASTHRLWNLLLLNARGLYHKLAEVITYMEEHRITIGGFTESKVFKTDLSRGHWKWLAGPETAPPKGSVQPKMGNGVLVDMRVHPGASRVACGKYTMWVMAPGGDSDLYFGVVYFPVYDAQAKEAQAEMLHYYRMYSDLGVVVMGGDLNVRCGMNADNVIDTPGRRLMRDAERHNITFVNAMELAAGEFTREEWKNLDKGTPQARTVLFQTTIDYTLMATRDTHRVVQFVVGDDVGFGSDHLHQFIQIDMGGTSQLVNSNRKPQFKEQWDLSGMTRERWKEFEMACDKEMIAWMADFDPVGPQSADDANAHVREWLDAFNAAGVSTVGKRLVCAKSKSWYPELAKVIAERKAAGRVVRETSGEEKDAAKVKLAELRRKLQSVSKRCKRAAQLKRLRSVNTSLTCSSTFWKNHRALSRDEVSNSLPSVVNDRDGNLVSDPLKVLQTWRDFTAELGREDVIPPTQRDHSDHREDGCRYDNEFARKVLQELRGVFVGDGVDELDAVITWDEVHSGISMLKAGKAAGLDGVLAELLHNAGLGCAMALAKLFNYVWTSGKWPPDWQKAFMIPLYKKVGSQLEPGNYRNLSIMSIVAKLFEKILDKRIRKWSERVHALSDLQGGFRCDRATIDQIFIMNEIIAERHERGLSSFLAFIDVRKAYDRVWRPGLWHKLREIGIGGRCFDLLQAMFSRVVRKVLINGDFTEEFEVCAGVPQGSVLSPYMYAVYINGLHRALADAGLGMRVHGRLVPLLLYADDIVLLARSADELKAMLRVTYEYARKWRFDINHGKSNVCVFGSKVVKEQAKSEQWRLGDDLLEFKAVYKYLGVETGKVRGRWNHALERFISNADTTLNLLLYRGGGSEGLYPPAFIRQYNGVCRPLMEYACELWEGEISQSKVDQLEAVQSDFLRSVASLKGTPSAVGLRTEFSVPTLQSRRMILKLGYWRKLCFAEHSRLFSLVFRRRHEQVLSGGGAHSCLRAFRDLLINCDMHSRWLNRSAMVEKAWRSAVRLAVEDIRVQEEAVRIASHSSLRLYTQLELKQTDIPLYLNDRSNAEGVHLLTKCRLGYLWTMRAIAKTVRDPSVNAMCRLCHYGLVEDIQHFLLDCPVLRPCRRQLEFRLQQVVPYLGEAGRQLMGRFSGTRAQRLSVLMGDLSVSLAVDDADDPVDVELAHNQAGKARYYTDKCVKNFLVACWRLRESLLGNMTVAAGCLVVAASGRSASDLLESQELFKEIDESRLWVGTRSFWSEWIPKPEEEERLSWPVRKGPSAFYAVKRGRSPGLYYRWDDCRRAVAGQVDSVFCGRPTLAEAEEWLTEGF